LIASSRGERRMTAVVLAAGRSTRMDRPKLHLQWGATTILGQVLETLRTAGIDDIVIAARRGDTAASEAARDVASNVAWVSEAAGTPTRSLQTALAHIAARPNGPPAHAILVLPGDMPLIEPATVRAVIAAFDAAPDPQRWIVAPALGDRRGHPVVFGAAHVPALAALGECERPRAVVEGAGEHLRLIAVDDIGVVTDIDDQVAYDRHRPK